VGAFPGRQRVGIQREVPVSDDDGTPVLSEFGEPQTTTVTVWVEGCLFEVPTAPDEQQGVTVTTSETGWALLPASGDGVIPAADSYGNPIPLPFLDSAGAPSISSSAWLIHDGLRYAMRGDAVLERDLRGRPNHVFCRCERERG
jgi:hypothetical protein